jgi:hypothetical protein
MKATSWRIYGYNDNRDEMIIATTFDTGETLYSGTWTLPSGMAWSESYGAERPYITRGPTAYDLAQQARREQEMTR